MSETLSRAERHLHLETTGRERRLTNSAPVAVRRLVYTTFSMYFDEPEVGQATASRQPYYEITDLPSGAAVTVEEVDPWEGGSITHAIDEVEWADGVTEEGHVLVSMRRLLSNLAVAKRNEERLDIKAEAVPITQHVERELKLIRANEPTVLKPGD